MTRKTSFLILIVGLFLLPLQQLVANQSAENENSLLWRVSGNGLAKPSYLFGTHHIVPVSFLETVPGWQEAFESTEQTVGELDMRNMMELQAMIMQHAMMPAGVTYASLLNADDLALLNNKLISLVGVGLEQLGMLKPAMLSNLIVVSMYQQHFPEMATSQSIDEFFQQQALLRSRPIVALDTFDSQVYALFGVNTIERQAELLMCLIHNPERGIEMIHRLHELYFAFDIKGLYALTNEEHEDDPCPPTEEERAALTRNRDLRNIDRLSAIIQEKSSFVAVGALHLPGEDGLIEGLRRAGYTVEPVR